MNLGVRAAHRATDTGAVCGGGGHAGVVACPSRDCPRACHPGQQMEAFCIGRRVAGAGEGGDFGGGLRGCLRPSESLRYSLGNVRFRKKLPFRGYPLDVVFAATSDVPILQAVLTLSANSCHTQMVGERQPCSRLRTFPFCYHALINSQHRTFSPFYNRAL